MPADRTARGSISQTIVLFIVPAAILGFLALALFYDFLGAQASEIAKLINSIELSCEAAIGLSKAAVGPASCGQSLPKVGLFFVLLAVWCVVANIITLSVFETVQSATHRLIIAVAVTMLLPGILLYKYWSVYPPQLTVPGLFAVCVVIETVALQALFAYRARKHPDGTVSPGLIGALFFASIVIFVALSLIFAYSRINLFNYVGSINTIVLYLVLAYTFVGGLIFYDRRTGVPFAALLLIWLVGLDYFGFGHGNTVAFRSVDPVQAAAPNPNLLKGNQQFLDWLAARRDRAAFANKDYPVYIVASAGGGVYAGVRSAYFLNFLQKECPAFAHHVFAISSVSGGGLGALAFAAQQQSAEPRALGPCAAEASVPADGLPQTPVLDDFFSKDLVSTIAGAGLFPNMLQRIIPLPIASFDRSQAFRKALGENWADALKKGDPSASVSPAGAPAQRCSSESFFGDCEIASYWRPGGDVPMLIFNATEVDTGSPVVLSNLDAEFYASTLAATNSPAFDDRSIYLVEGASLSARFPIALPAGYLPGFKGSKSIRLVDGGYFDSSGLTMAQAVKTAIDQVARDQALAVNVRIIFLGEKAPSIYALIEKDIKTGETAKPSNSLSGAEITAHFTALLRSRDQQGVQTVAEVFRPRSLRTAKDDPLDFQWDPYIDDKTGTPCRNIPLAWYLAPCTLKVLQVRLRDALEVPSLATLRADLSPN